MTIRSVLSRRRRKRLVGVIAAVAVVIGGLTSAYLTDAPATGQAPPTPSFVDGRLGDKVCKTYTVKLFGFHTIYYHDLGWAWARTILGGPQTRDATGTVTKSEVSYTDFPSTHLSHDQTTDIRLDPGQEDLLSDVGLPNEEKPYLERFLKTPTTLHVEWETGLVPGAIGKGDKELYFPRWAWPSVGDRIWADGQWIFDCGHGTPVCHIRPHCLTPRQHQKHYLTELHPLRAIASMRSQVKTIAGSHGQPVPVTATDLYIHGMAGYVYDLLNCGVDILLAQIIHACPVKSGSIRSDYTFTIRAPPRPTPTARLITEVRSGPGNTIDVAPILTTVGVNRRPKVRVRVPLEDSRANPSDVYARRIYVGWDRKPPRVDLIRVRLTIRRMILGQDHERDPGDCECTFFWANLDRGERREWIRLSDYSTKSMHDYDDRRGAGDGVRKFEGARWEFWIREDQSFTLRANGYDQDCFDGLFGTLYLDDKRYIRCKATTKDNDRFADFKVTFTPPYGRATGVTVTPTNNEYAFEIHVQRLRTIR